MIYYHGGTHVENHTQFTHQMPTSIWTRISYHVSLGDII